MRGLWLPGAAFSGLLWFVTACVDVQCVSSHVASQGPHPHLLPSGHIYLSLPFPMFKPACVPVPQGQVAGCVGSTT